MFTGFGTTPTIGSHGFDARSCRSAPQHKELMFRAPDHRYDRAVPGSFPVPTADIRKKPATDYERMSEMVFAMPSEFEAVMTSWLHLK
jgi:hypothetical protein